MQGGREEKEEKEEKDGMWLRKNENPPSRSGGTYIQTSGITISTNKYDGKTLNKHVQTSKCDFKTQNAIQKFKSGISKRKI